MRGRVLALQAMLFLGSTPIGGPIVGWVSQQFGARYGIGVGAVAALAAGVFGLLKAGPVRVDDRRKLFRRGPVQDDAVAPEVELVEDGVDALVS